MEIENFPNYLIYPDGRVYSKYYDKFLRPGIGTTGYYLVILCNHGKRQTCKVHRLVAMHYIPNPENKCDVDHKNRDKLDNRVENLRWATRTENCQNKGHNKANKSGHKNISYSKYHDRWKFQKRIRGKMYRTSFKSKIDCICYKYIFLLKHKIK